MILAGTQFVRPSNYEALAQLVLGSSASNVDPELLKEIIAGEQRNLILQALCRGHVRRCENGSCPATNAYVIGSSRHGFEALLKDSFPGVRIMPWRPILKPLKGKVGEAISFIVQEIFENGREQVTGKQVMKAIGWTNHANFRKAIRRHPKFIAALSEGGLIEDDCGLDPVRFKRNPFVSTEVDLADDWDF